MRTHLRSSEASCGCSVDVRAERLHARGHWDDNGERSPTQNRQSEKGEGMSKNREWTSVRISEQDKAELERISKEEERTVDGSIRLAIRMLIADRKREREVQ